MTGPQQRAPSLGDRVGRYRIRGYVASGGMASVYLAELEGPAAFQKQVALKVIHPHLMNDEAFVRLFLDEARIAARLHHPNIVQTFDLIEEPGRVAIVMEYAPGVAVGALRRKIDVQPRIPLLAWIGAEAAAGLEYAHTLSDPSGRPMQIVHRDVSPANIQLGFDGRVRLVDFGIARARGRLSTTADGSLKGTLAYMAPEQFTGTGVTFATDVWSLGVVLWELVAGERLFRSENEGETAYSVLSREVPRLETIQSDLPAAFCEAVHRALDRDPARRWPSAAAMEETLRECVPRRLDEIRTPLVTALAPLRDELLARVQAGESPEASVQEDLIQTVTAPSLSAAAVSSSTSSGARRHRRWAALAATGVAACTLVLVLWHPGAEDSSAARPSGPAAPSEPRGPARTTEVPAPAPRVSIEVTSATPGAHVALDGRPLGAAPVRLAVDAAPGPHVVRVSADGFVTEERSVTLERPLELAIDLAPDATAAKAPLKRRPSRPRSPTYDVNVYR